MDNERIDGREDRDREPVTGSDGIGSNVESATAGGLRVADPSAGVVKRGRGRPRGSKNAGKSEGTGESAGKPDAPRKTQKAPQAAVSIGGIESILYSIHLFASSVVPEAALDEDEAKELAKAVAAVNEHYAVAFDPKKLAWFALIGVAGKIYGSRVMAYMLRKKTEEAAQRPRIAPLAGTPVPARPVTPQASPRQTVAPSAVPQNIRQMFSDPTTIPDLDHE
jgi:hypothetical protein